MPRPMSFSFSNTHWKRKNRWRFYIERLVDIENIQTPILPPLKASRPSISFKEQSIEHVIETISRPTKPEWSSLDITLYDLHCNRNPVFDWLRKLYDPQRGSYGFSVGIGELSFIIPQADLQLLNGCGDVLESWRYENLWPQKIDWGDLDMENNDVITVDISFKYDRAYFVNI
jgi:hypothetical protein